MTAQIISRHEWEARKPKGNYSFLSRTKGVKVHYTGGRVDPDIIKDHSLCYKMVKQIQNFHMDGNGWIDIGYSLVACPHRFVFIARGPNHLPAANGKNLNSGHYAVLGLVGNSGFTQPNDGLLHGILDAIDYLREVGEAGREIKGHRDGYATSCPGNPLYKWVKAGAPRPDEDTFTEVIMRQLPVLGVGDEGYDVKSVRGLAFARGFVPSGLVDDTKLRDWLDNLKFDGAEETEGVSLEEVIRNFQADRGLTTDGIVGEKTWKALNRL